MDWVDVYVMSNNIRLKKKTLFTVIHLTKPHYLLDVVTDDFYCGKAVLLVCLLRRLSVTWHMLQKLRYTTYKNTA
jgi:hypothetical protein